MTNTNDGALRLAAELRARGGAAAEVLRDPPVGSGHVPGPAQVAATGPRAGGFEADYELLTEMILEGSLLHYGGARVLDDADPDLALLLGDQLYAMGLSRLAELGDLEAVAELADLISLLAQARSQSAQAGTEALVSAIWRAGATAIGWGASEEHRSAKALARAGDGRAAQALQQAAHEVGS